MDPVSRRGFLACCGAGAVGPAYSRDEKPSEPLFKETPHTIDSEPAFVSLQVMFPVSERRRAEVREMLGAAYARYARGELTVEALRESATRIIQLRSAVSPPVPQNRFMAALGDERLLTHKLERLISPRFTWDVHGYPNSGAVPLHLVKPRAYGVPTPTLPSPCLDVKEARSREARFGDYLEYAAAAIEELAIQKRCDLLSEINVWAQYDAWQFSCFAYASCATPVK